MTTIGLELDPRISEDVHVSGVVAAQSKASRPHPPHTVTTTALELDPRNREDVHVSGVVAVQSKDSRPHTHTDTQ